jgi:hypothetical protein
MSNRSDWAWEDWQAEFDERAAIAEFDGGLTRSEAEDLATREVYEAMSSNRRTDGILYELIAADRRRRDSEFEALAAEVGLSRFPYPWGPAHIVPDGPRVFRFAEHGEPEASPALIVPAITQDGLEDLVAYGLQSKRTLTRRDLAALIGDVEADRAREADTPLLVFDNLYGWLRGSGLGIVVVDWGRLGPCVDGVRVLFCSVDLAPLLYEATRTCWPRPAIATRRGVRFAA